MKAFFTGSPAVLQVGPHVAGKLLEVAEVLIQDSMHPGDVDIEVSVHKYVAKAGHGSESSRELGRDYLETKQLIDG